MLKAYKYRIYPTSEQKLYLAKTFGCTRFIYNQMLADRIIILFIALKNSTSFSI